MVISTWDNVNDDGGGEGGDASSTSSASSREFPRRNAFIRGYLTETRERGTRNSQRKTRLLRPLKDCTGGPSLLRILKLSPPPSLPSAWRAETIHWSSWPFRVRNNYGVS